MIGLRSAWTTAGIETAYVPMWDRSWQQKGGCEFHLPILSCRCQTAPPSCSTPPSSLPPRRPRKPPRPPPQRSTSTSSSRSSCSSRSSRRWRPRRRSCRLSLTPVFVSQATFISFARQFLILSQWGVTIETGNISCYCLRLHSPSGCHSHAVSWINIQHDGSRAPQLSL